MSVEFNRRNFLKTVGIGAGALYASSLACNPPKKSQPIEYRKNQGLTIACWCHLDRDFLGTESEIKADMDRIKNAGIDILLPFIHYEEQAMYNTALPFPEKKDRLTVILAAATEREIEIHPTILPLTDPGVTPEQRERRSYRSNKPGGNHCDGRFCASWPETRESGFQITRDVMAHHGVTGIHLDAIRYIDTGQSLDWPCQCDACKAKYGELLGKETITAEDLKVPGMLDKFMEFRGQNIRSLMEKTRELVRQKGLVLSMAARAAYFEAALVEGQDWVQWAREGLMEYICPMNYSTLREVHRNHLATQMALIKDSVPIYDGIGRLSSAGELTPAQMLQQAEDALELGAKGLAIFHLNGMNQKDFTELAAFKNANAEVAA